MQSGASQCLQSFTLVSLHELFCCWMLVLQLVVAPAHVCGCTLVCDTQLLVFFLCTVVQPFDHRVQLPSLCYAFARFCVWLAGHEREL